MDELLLRGCHWTPHEYRLAAHQTCRHRRADIFELIMSIPKWLRAKDVLSLVNLFDIGGLNFLCSPENRRFERGLESKTEMFLWNYVRILQRYMNKRHAKKTFTSRRPELKYLLRVLTPYRNGVSSMSTAELVVAGMVIAGKRHKNLGQLLDKAAEGLDRYSEAFRENCS